VVTRTTAQQAASTLASFGTSAANQIAQQEATAPAATASNIRLINQRLQDLLSGPQGHDALARNLTSQIEQNRP
jgi:phage baseplate assembly protein W